MSKLLGGLLFERSVRKARTASRNGDAAKACEYYHRALQSRPNAMGIWVQLGHLQKGLKLRADALNSYTTAIQLGSEDMHARHYVFGAKSNAPLIEVNTSSSASESGSLPLRTTSDDRLRGDAANAAHQWTEAREAYAAYLLEHPGDFSILVQHGHMCKESGALRAGEQSYIQAFRINPHDADLTLQLGHLMVQLGQTRRALGLYKRALQLDPMLPSAQAIWNWVREQQTWR